MSVLLDLHQGRETSSVCVSDVAGFSSFNFDGEKYRAALKANSVLFSSPDIESNLALK